jgi:hypothetical protein
MASQQNVLDASFIYPPFQTLDILSADLIVQDVCDLVRRDFLASRTFMDTA